MASISIMKQKDLVYTKQDSFVEIRHSRPLSDVLPRIKKLRENFDTINLSHQQKGILKLALGEIFDEIKLDKKILPFTLHSFNIAEIDKLKDEEIPRFLIYRYRYETFPQRFKLDDFPPCLQIEPASICNYRCLFCYQVDEEFTKKGNGMMGTMSFDMFKQIIDQAEGRCEAITLASRGEPLICPDFEPMIKYASGKFLAIKLNTNAWFLDEKLCYAILEAGVNTVVFSADAASEPAYSRLRVNGKLKKVYANIAKFRDIRAKYFPKSRVITRVSGVKVPSADSLEDMEKFWGELVDQVAFVNYNPWENSYEKPINSIDIPCSDLWRRMFVWWDGTVNPCDSDYKSKLKIGSVSENSISRLWNSESYSRLRSAHLEQKRGECSPCNKCVVI
jgi:radical SAM protein with 4Fe4S-binding SPASM domain